MIRKVNEKLVGTKCKNHFDALKKVLKKEFGDGEVSGGSNFIFKYTPKDGRREKTIYTEPTNMEKQDKIRITAIESVQDELIKDLNDLVGDKTSGSVSCFSEEDKNIIKKELESRGYTVEVSGVVGDADNKVSKFHIEYYKKANECGDAGCSSKPKRVIKKVTEGAGAGYEVRANNFSLIKINSLGNMKVDDKDIITLEDCDIDVTCDVVGESYDAGGEVNDAKAKIRRLEFDFNWNNDFEQCLKAFKGSKTVNKSAAEDIIKEELYTLETRSKQGGGWFHVTFTGLIAGTDDDIKTANNLVSALIEMQDQDQITFLDRGIDDNNRFVQYHVFKDGDIVDSFEDEETAIKFAKENDCDSVDAEGMYINTYGGDVESIPDDTYTVWTKESANESVNKKVDVVSEEKKVEEGLIDDDAAINVNRAMNIKSIAEEIDGYADSILAHNGSIESAGMCLDAIKNCIEHLQDECGRLRY